MASISSAGNLRLVLCLWSNEQSLRVKRQKDVKRFHQKSRVSASWCHSHSVTCTVCNQRITKISGIIPLNVCTKFDGNSVVAQISVNQNSGLSAYIPTAKHIVQQEAGGKKGLRTPERTSNDNTVLRFQESILSPPLLTKMEQMCQSNRAQRNQQRQFVWRNRREETQVPCVIPAN